MLTILGGGAENIVVMMLFRGRVNADMKLAVPGREGYFVMRS